MRSDCRTVLFRISDVAAGIVSGFLHTRNPDI